MLSYEEEMSYKENKIETQKLNSDSLDQRISENELEMQIVQTFFLGKDRSKWLKHKPDLEKWITLLPGAETTVRHLKSLLKYEKIFLCWYNASNNCRMYIKKTKLNTQVKKMQRNWHNRDLSFI